MKSLTTIALLSICIGFTHAQNVGIGTTTPAYPLTVIGKTNKGIVQKDVDVEVGFFTAPSGLAILQTWSNHPLGFATNNGSQAMVLATNGNLGIGIGLSQPTNRLHVVGSAAAANNATIYGINNGSAGNGILGISNAQNTNGVQGISTDGTGIYGYSNDFRGVAGSTISGTAVYGNSIAGYGLEISGKVKIAGGNTDPENGAVLTSDAVGNAVWKPRRVAFKVVGVSSGHEEITDGSSRRVQYGVESFDLSNNYALLANGASPTANSSVFTAPVNGIYHFDLGCHLSPNGIVQEIEFAYVTLLRNRGGTETELARAEGKRYYEYFGNELPDGAGFNISVTESLLAGDRIYVVIYHSTGTNASILSGSPHNWFSGHLVFAN